MRFPAASILGLAPALLAARPVEAQVEPSPLSLTVQAPTECSSNRALHAEVMRLARVGVDSPRRLRAQVTIEQIGEHSFSLRLVTELDGVSGERTFEGGSCQAVSDAAALTLALMLNPEVERDTEPRLESAPPAASAIPPPTPLPPSPPSAAPPRATEPAPPSHGMVAAHLGANLGMLPKPAPEFGLGFGLSLGAVSAWLGVSYAPTQDVRLSGSEAGGSLWLGSASLLGCWDLLASRGATFGPCAGAEVSRIEGRGIGVTVPEEGAIFWTSGVLGFSAGGRLAGALELRGSLQGLVPPERPRVFLEEIGEVHRPGPVAARAQVGLAVELW